MSSDSTEGENGITEDQEDSIFEEVADGRTAGKSLREMSAEKPAGGDGVAAAAVEKAAAGVVDEAAAGAGAGGEAAGVAGDAGAQAGAEAAVAAAVADTKAGASAGKAAEVVAPEVVSELNPAGAEAFVGEFRKTLGTLGDMVIEPASEDGTRAALTLKEFDEQYPGVSKRIDLVASLAFQMATKRVMEQLGPELNYVKGQRAAEGRESLLREIDGEGVNQVAGARAVVASSEFADWYKKQPAAIQQLGQSSDATQAVRLLRFFQSDTGFKAKGGGVGRGGRTDGERQGLLDVAKAGGGAGRKPAALGQVLGSSGGQQTFTIDEDEADAEFNRLAAEKYGTKA